MGTNSARSYCEISELFKIWVDSSAEAPITAPTNSFCKSGLAEDWRRIAPHELVGRLPKPSTWAPCHLVGQAVPGDGPDVGRFLHPSRPDGVRADRARRWVMAPSFLLESVR